MLSLTLFTASASAQYFRGVNLSGAEWGTRSDNLYTYSSKRTFDYFGSKGLNIFRVCLRWERLQPALRGPLDPIQLGHVRDNIAWARANSMKVILEPHNFARYNPDPSGQLQTGYAIDDYYDGVIKVTTADFADFWVRMSNEFRNETAVYAYDLTNEPHDIDNWEQISQAALTAIRNNGDDKLIMVPGNSWSNAYFWPQSHPNAWIADPANNFMYEAHIYFDYDYSGSYANPINGVTYPTTYDAQLAQNQNLATVGATRVRPFLDWCRTNGVRGYLGEYGIPNDDARWNAVLEGMFAELDQAMMNGSYWAAGEWWGDYALSVQPGGDFNVDRPQTPTLLAHRGAAFLWTVSAAYGYLETASPDSLVSGYGVNLVPDGVTTDNVLVELTESSGRVTPATVLYASPQQINYLVPAGLAGTRLDVAVKYSGRATAGGAIRLAPLAPALFSANQSGQGVAAAWVVRHTVSDPQPPREPVATWDAATQKYVPVPIDLGPETDVVGVELYGTGFRGVQNPAAATATIGGTTLPLYWIGANSDFLGLDQANIIFPRSLAGAGEVPVVLTIDSQATNAVTLAFK